MKKLGIFIGMLSVLAVTSNSFGMWRRVGSDVMRRGSRVVKQFGRHKHRLAGNLEHRGQLGRQHYPKQQQLSNVERRFYSGQQQPSKGRLGQFFGKINPMKRNFLSLDAKLNATKAMLRGAQAVLAGTLSWIGFDMLQEKLNLPHILVRSLSEVEKATMDSWLKEDNYKDLFHDIKGDKAKIQYVAQQIIDNDFAIKDTAFSEKIIGKIFEVASPAVRHGFVEGMYDALLAGKEVSPMLFSTLDKTRYDDFLDSFMTHPNRFSALVKNSDLIDRVVWRMYLRSDSPYYAETFTRLILSVQDDKFIRNAARSHNGKKMLMNLADSLEDSGLRNQLEQKISQAVQAVKDEPETWSFWKDFLGN